MTTKSIDRNSENVFNPETRTEVTIITGGASGIGQHAALELVARGHKVVILDQNLDGATQVARSADPSGDSIVAYACDVTDEDAVSAGIDFAVATFGSVTGLVTAAGVRHSGPTCLEVDLDVWRSVNDINVLGTLIPARQAARRMQQTGGGAIVTVASVASVLPRVRMGAYAVSKAAVLHLTRVLALELVDSAIRVNAVCPGATDTGMFAEAIETDGNSTWQRKIHGSLDEFRVGPPMRRISHPREQAKAIAFLLSDDASYITGTSLYVDGGETAA